MSPENEKLVEEARAQAHNLQHPDAWSFDPGPHAKAIAGAAGALIDRLAAALTASQAFKEYVHKRLDDAGIPTHPEGPHSAAGCRVGDRLDIALTASQEREKAAYARGLLRAAEIVGKRAHMSELMDDVATVAQVLRYCEQSMQEEATAIPALKEDAQ